LAISIDDISEMFGGPGRSGFSQLAAFDTTGDGLVTAADARFGELRVWRDLDGDGYTDDGELFTLDASANGGSCPACRRRPISGCRNEPP
jgi:hypothetical protein